MKSAFSGFYSATKDELSNIWKSQSTIFIFDTNCLLNLYRCEKQTRDEILSVMESISHKIWLPFHVGFEYQRNRKKIIYESLAGLKEVEKGLTSSTDLLDKLLSQGKIKKDLYNPLSQDISEFKSRFSETISNFINDKLTPRIEDKVELTKTDFIRVQLDKIIESNHGHLPSQDEINKINEEGEERYSKLIPPGFKDSKKEGVSRYNNVEFKDKFGDLYLWKEIIQKASSENIENVIFVCDDVKEDWWFKLEGMRHGALEELQTEILTSANIKFFKLMTQSTFLHEAKEYITDVTISESSVKETELLSNEKNKKNLARDHSEYNEILDLHLSQQSSNKKHNEYLEKNFIKAKDEYNSIINKVKHSSHNLYHAIIKSTKEKIQNHLYKCNNYINKFDEYAAHYLEDDILNEIYDSNKKLEDNYKSLKANLMIINHTLEDSLYNGDTMKIVNYVIKESNSIMNENNEIMDNIIFSDEEDI